MDKLGKYTYGNVMKFSEIKYIVLHLGQDNPCYQQRLGEKQIKSSSAQKGLERMTGNVHSWAAPKAAWPAGRGR